jgi:hypothetical protein
VLDQLAEKICTKYFSFLQEGGELKNQTFFGAISSGKAYCSFLPRSIAILEFYDFDLLD